MGKIQPLFLQAIEAAVARSRRLDLDEIIERVSNTVPSQVASTESIDARRNWLNKQPDSRLLGVDAEVLLERIISGNELQDITYLEKGMISARAVCRIAVRTPNGQSAWGTGFLIAPGVVITNNHVLPTPDWATGSQAQFRYERTLEGVTQDPIPFRFAPQSLFFTHKTLDFTIVAVEENSADSKTKLSMFGFLPLDGRPGKVAEGEWLTIVQHPAGELKQLCVRENQLLKRDDDVLWYSTDTRAGSSGSPVFSNDWVVVALHHSGVPEQQNGRIQTVGGDDFDENRHTEQDIKWQANEGIRVSRIVQTLKELTVKNPLVQRVLSAPELASALQSQPQPSQHVSRSDRTMSQKVTVSLEIDDAGRVTIANSSQEFAGLGEAAKAKKKGTRDASGNIIEAPADPTFLSAALKGYDPTFLGGEITVLLPVLPADAPVAKLIGKPDSHELKYENFSIIQNGTRRLAYVSAANIEGGGRFRLSGRDDNWLIDRRIRPDQQLGPSYYTRNKLDRGHLTRREDLEFGTSVFNAVRSANGTNVYTNCAPQHEQFNQGFGQGIGGDNNLWQGLELYLLEQTAVSQSLKICVFTGPVFDETDPVYRGFKIPLDFWKVIVGLDSENKPFATAYLLSQEGLVEVTQLDEAATVPFGQYKTYQVKVDLISQLTGMAFACKIGKEEQVALSTFDPLENPTSVAILKKRRRSSQGTLESAMSPDGALSSLQDIILS